MKLDKESIAGLAICVLLLIAWFAYNIATVGKGGSGKSDYEPGYGEMLSDTATAPDLESAGKQTRIDTDTNGKNADAFRVTGEKPVEKVAEGEEVSAPELPESKHSTSMPMHVLENDLHKTLIDPLKGCVASTELKKFLKSEKNSNIVLLEGCSPGALNVLLPETWILSSVKVLEKDPNSIKTLRNYRSGDSELSLISTWSLDEGYVLNYDFDLENTGGTPVELGSLLVDAGAVPDINTLCGDDVRRESQTVDYLLKEGNEVRDKDGKTIFKKHDGKLVQENPARWIAVANKYFATVLLPESPFEDGNMIYAVEIGEEGSGKYLLNTAGHIKKLKLPPGAKFPFRSRFYAGPKELKRLSSLGTETSKIMHMAMWGWLEGISQLLLRVLLWLWGFCGNYGVAIIILTVIVRMLFWPVTQKANSSMQKMQKIQPLVQEIRSKYKSDPQKMNAKVMELYREHKVNPLGGCLPIFLQMPVFIALYSTLNSAIELRHSSFLWASDLSLPDTIYTVKGLNLDINPLILAMSSTMLIQQLLTPSSADPAQKKMMMIMPLVMLVLLYSLPSGLTLYWTVSQAIGIAQLLINKKMMNKGEPLTTAVPQKN